MDCIYRESIVYARSHESVHVRQFREDIDGTRKPIFPSERAIIKLTEDKKRYEVRTVPGELFVVGIGGLNEAFRRVNYAQPSVEITIVDFVGKRYTPEEYEKAIAPVLFQVYYTQRESDGKTYIAMEARRNKRKLDECNGAGVDIAGFIAQTMDKQRGKGVRDYVLQWGRSPLPGFEDYEGDSKIYSFPELKKKATEIKEMESRNG